MLLGPYVAIQIKQIQKVKFRGAIEPHFTNHQFIYVTTSLSLRDSDLRITGHFVDRSPMKNSQSVKRIFGVQFY